MQSRTAAGHEDYWKLMKMKPSGPNHSSQNTTQSQPFPVCGPVPASSQAPPLLFGYCPDSNRGVATKEPIRIQTWSHDFYKPLKCLFQPDGWCSVDNHTVRTAGKHLSKMAVWKAEQRKWRLKGKGGSVCVCVCLCGCSAVFLYQKKLTNGCYLPEPPRTHTHKHIYYRFFLQLMGQTSKWLVYLFVCLNVCVFRPGCLLAGCPQG